MATILNGIFKDKMVFQWGAELRVFGCCDTDCDIKAVLFKDGKEVSSNTSHTEEDGSFLVCLEPVDEPWAAVYGVAQNRTRLKRLSSSSSFCI